MHTLKNLLKSSTRIKILNLLLFSDRQYHLRDISRKIKKTPIYVSKELENLKKINLIKKDRMANLTLYSINNKSKIISELRSIFKKCK